MASLEVAVSERKALVVDVDGTICPIKNPDQNYADLPVYPGVVELLQSYRKQGFAIILHTARNMKTHSGNLGRINADTAPTLLTWLKKHEVPYDEIHYGKPWPGNRGFYVDDRAVRPREFVRHSEECLYKKIAADREVSYEPVQIVISMAGGSSRFAQAGIATPKYQLSVKGLSLFYWSMLSLLHHVRVGDRFFFITLKVHKASEFIIKQCEFLGLDNYQIIELDTQTDGQATTVMAAEVHWNASAPLVIYNIDTYCIPGSLKTPPLDNYDGWIPCFSADGDHWSFVRCEADGEAVEVAEKSRISENCSIGYYWFSSASLYSEGYRNFFQGAATNREKYIAPLYQWLISQGRRIYCSEIPKESVHVLGTPDELSRFASEAHVMLDRV